MTGYRTPPPRAPDLRKQAARQAGMVKFQGNDCKYGHGGLRYASTGQCVLCVPLYKEKSNE